MRSGWAVVGLVIATSVATADNVKKADADAAAREGQALYKSGDYARAAERFERAYSLQPDPAHLFNIAQAYRLGEQCAKAATAYRKLLTVVGNGANADKIRGYIEQMDACAKQQATPPPVPTVEPVPDKPEPVVIPPSVEPQPQPQPVRVTTGSPALRYTGLGVGVVGLGGIAYGVVQAVLASQTAGSREELCADGCQWTMELADQADRLDKQGERQQLRARIALGVGGGALAVGTVLYLLGREQTVERLAVVPVEGGAMAFGTFRY